MVYIPADAPESEVDGSDADVDVPPSRPVDPDAVEDAGLDDLREQVAALTRTVEHLVTREHEFRSSQEVVAEVAEVVVDDLEQRGALARDSLDDARDDRDGLDDDREQNADADGGTSRGFY